MKTTKKQKEIIRKLVENAMGGPKEIYGIYVPNVGMAVGYEFGKTTFDNKHGTVVQEIIFKMVPQPISYTITFR